MPVSLVRYKDKSGFTGKKIFEFEDGVTLADVLLSQEVPDQDIEIYINSIDEVGKTTIDDVGRILDNDIVYIVGVVHGVVTEAFDFVSENLGNIAQPLLESIYPLPDIPNNATGNVKQSPNNSTNPQGNIARPYQAIPELFGTGKAWPDLLQPAELNYVNNLKTTREIFCLGIGQYTISNTYKGDTNSDDIAGMTVDIYDNGNVPPDLVVAKLADNVDNQELIAADDPTRESASRGVFVSATFTNTQSFTFTNSTSEVTTTGVDVVRNCQLEVGDTFVVSGSASNNGTLTINALSYASGTLTIGVDETLTDETVSCTVTATGTTTNYIYWFDVNVEVNLNLEVGSDFTIADTASNNGDFSIDAIDQDVDLQYGACVKFEVAELVVDEDDESALLQVVGLTVPWVGYFQNNGEATTLRTYLKMPRGIRSSDGNAINVVVLIEDDETDENGVSLGNPVIQTFYQFSGNSQDQQFATVDRVVTKGYYRTRARRTTGHFEGASDLVQWEANAAILDYDGSGFGDVTIIDVTTVASGLSSNSNTKFNVDYTRKLPSWTPSGGYDPTLTNASDGFRAALYQHVVAAVRPISQMDVEDLYDIYNGLSDSQLGRFNYSFDDADVGHGARMKTILDTSRIITYRDGQIWRFIRNQPKSKTAAFNRRNMASPLNETFTFGYDGEFDSIELFYRDANTNKRKSYKRKLDLVSETIVDDELGDSVREIELVGCNNDLQARDRINLEIRQLLYSRRGGEFKALRDGSLVDMGDRISVADIFDGELFEGNIKAINGNEYTTSEKLDFTDDGSFYGFITDDLGELSSNALITKTGDFTFTATFDKTAFIADGVTAQASSRYFIGKNDNLTYYDYIVQTKNGGNNATMALSVYNESVYELDGV